MHVVAIYNNKGGVGKSTLTVLLAEILASNRKKRVLVIDLDAQASSSCSLLRRDLVTAAQAKPYRLADMVRRLRIEKHPFHDLDQYLTFRPATDARGSALAEIAVLVLEKDSILELEEEMKRRQELFTLRDYLKPKLKDFDFVLIDVAGNVTWRDKLTVAALIMSDFVLIPVEPSQISLRALPDTFDLIHQAHLHAKSPTPAVIGLVLNKTDRRTEQYRSKFPSIIAEVGKGLLPPLFTNILPDTPALATATDETIDFRTLRDRFSTYYDHVRKVALELESRCESYVPPPQTEPPRFAQRFRELLSRFVSYR